MRSIIGEYIKETKEQNNCMSEMTTEFKRAKKLKKGHLIE
jgi:hypothetical protein